MEYAIDVADACRERGHAGRRGHRRLHLRRAAREFYRHMDAANVDLKAFTEEFYKHVAVGHLQPVLDTLRVPASRDRRVVRDHDPADPRAERLRRRARRDGGWIAEHLGPDVPLHFTAFHPDFKMLDVPHTPPATLTRAREIALRHGLQLRLHRQRPRHAPGRARTARGAGGW